MGSWTLPSTTRLVFEIGVGGPENVWGRLMFAGKGPNDCPSEDPFNLRPDRDPF